MFFVGAGRLFERAGQRRRADRRRRPLPVGAHPPRARPAGAAGAGRSVRRATFRRTVIASACTFCAQVMSYVALPFHFQVALGAGVLATGLYMTAWPSRSSRSASFSGRLAARVSASRLCSLGTLVLALGLGGGGGAGDAGVAPILRRRRRGGARLRRVPAGQQPFVAAVGAQGAQRRGGRGAGDDAAVRPDARRDRDDGAVPVAPGDAAPRLGLLVAAGFALVAAPSARSMRALRLSAPPAPARAELHLAQHQRQRDRAERHQHQHPEHVDIGEQRRLLRDLLADPGERLRFASAAEAPAPWKYCVACLTFS